MGFTAAGTPIQVRTVFNSGTLDFGTNRLVEVDNLSLSTEFGIVDLYVLGSIIAQDKARHSLKVTLSGLIKSFAPEMEALIAGNASSGAAPASISILDGQPTLQSPILNIFDKSGNQIQYQFSGALFKSNKMTLKMGEYATWEFNLEAKNVVELYS